MVTLQVVVLLLGLIVLLELIPAISENLTVGPSAEMVRQWNEWDTITVANGYTVTVETIGSWSVV